MARKLPLPTENPEGEQGSLLPSLRYTVRGEDRKSRSDLIVLDSSF